jgi:hypothetical protein
MCAGCTYTPAIIFKKFYILPTECICVDGSQKQQVIFPYARAEGVVRATTFIIIGGKQKHYHSESTQAVPACPGEGKLEAR